MEPRVQTLVAIYSSRAEATQVKEELVTAGVPADNIALDLEGTTTSARDAGDAPTGSWWDWLFGSSVPDADREIYSLTSHEGRAAVSVQLADETRRDAIESFLHEHGAIDHFSLRIARDTGRH